MTAFFHSYFWQNGIPYGINKLEDGTNCNSLAFKIVTDPYRKNIAIESYQGKKFVAVLYDNSFLDFRHLKPALQRAWHQQTVFETNDTAIVHIRDQNDRLVYIETHSFNNGFCRLCRVVSAHGIHLSTNRLSYTNQGDEFNQVVLYDANDVPVMFKRYESDPATGAFTNMLKEEWDLKDSEKILRHEPVLIKN